jgi:membrane protease YdiL (CAAX protease family)
MIAGLYMPGTPIWYQLSMFTIEILSFTVIISVLRLKSNSIWPAILLHASHNYVDQVFCMQLTSSANSTYFVGETGFITVIATILVAVGTVKFFWKNVSPKTGVDLSGSMK